jgi:polygalacturonase
MPTPVFSIASEGGKGDNQTSNTEGFKAAVAKIKAAGGGTLLVPEGTWLTGPFNLTSNMTLYLARGGTIQGNTDLGEWPLMPAMRSYGEVRREREWPRQWWGDRERERDRELERERQRERQWNDITEW